MKDSPSVWNFFPRWNGEHRGLWNGNERVDSLVDNVGKHNGTHNVKCDAERGGDPVTRAFDDDFLSEHRRLQCGSRVVEIQRSFRIDDEGRHRLGEVLHGFADEHEGLDDGFDLAFGEYFVGA